MEDYEVVYENLNSGTYPTGFSKQWTRSFSMMVLLGNFSCTVITSQRTMASSVKK